MNRLGLNLEKNNMSASINTSPIINFYKNKSILITGGTGFLGTVLIEKLLRDCSEIKNIYMLIKGKSGLTPQQRLSTYINSQVFQRIRENNPKTIEKLIPIPSNIAEEDLGMSENDIETVKKEVNIVFHLAANLHFQLPLAEAMRSNTYGTAKLVQLCKTMPNLVAFVYVSTTYCNSQNVLTAEKVYDTTCPLNVVSYVVDELGEHSLTRNIMEGRPNTYTYSKALAEQLLAKECSEIPAAIVRPSVILSALSEPTPGWIQGKQGANNLLIGLGKGHIRCWHGEAHAVADIIPVDFVSNTIIAVAWDIHKRRASGHKDMKVFNCCSGVQNPVTIGAYYGISTRYSKIYYKRETLIPPAYVIIKHRLLYRLIFWLLHMLPAYICDGFDLVLGRKRSALRNARRLDLLNAVLGYFTSREFTFVDYNFKQLRSDMHEDDKNIFNFDVKAIDWEDYLRNYVLGMKKYLLNEE